MKTAIRLCLFTLLLAPGLCRAQEYAVDAVHSSIIFRIKHLDVSWAYGRFNDISGKFNLSDQPDAKNVIDISVKVGSVDTANEARDKHLKAADFFNVEKFPTAKFKSTKIESKGKGEFEVTGDLTLMGQTKSITFTATKTGEGKHPMGGEIQGFETTVTFKRSDFGMKGYIPMIGDEVTLRISMEGAKK